MEINAMIEFEIEAVKKEEIEMIGDDAPRQRARLSVNPACIAYVFEYADDKDKCSIGISGFDDEFEILESYDSAVKRIDMVLEPEECFACKVAGNPCDGDVAPCQDCGSTDIVCDNGKNKCLVCGRICE